MCKWIYLFEARFSSMTSLIVKARSERQNRPAAYSRKMNFIGRNRSISAGPSCPMRYPESIAVL